MNISLKDMEHIRQIYRQSAFVLVHPLLVCAMLVILPAYAVFRFGDSAIFKAFLIWAALVIIYAARIILIWWLNRYVVTNQRLLHYSQKGLFDQTVTETPHERILNISYKTDGIISSLVGYGDVEVQIVGLMEPIILKNISMPMEIKDYLWDMHSRVSSDKSNKIYAQTDAMHLQERVGYTKKNKVN